MSHPVFDISGRTALITGSSRGIGRALAQGLHDAGCDVVLHGRDAAAAERAAGELGARHVAFDVTDAAAVARGVEEAGPLHILVNNAGIQHREPLLELSHDDWRRVVDVNLASAFLVAREAARGMVERGSGKIVNVASLQAQFARPGIAAYAAAKGGLKMLTQSMCAEWGAGGRAGQRDRARVLRDGHDAAARRRRGVQRLGARAHARGPLGTGRGARGDAPVPRLSRRRLRQRPDHLRRRRDVVGAVSY